MKAWEAVRYLQQMDQTTEVILDFPGKKFPTGGVYPYDDYLGKVYPQWLPPQYDKNYPQWVGPNNLN